MLGSGLETPEQFERLLASEKWHQFLIARLKNLPQADALALVGADGRLVNTSRRRPAPALDLSDRDLSMHLETTAAKKTTKLDMVVVGRAVYARLGSDHWQQGTRSNFEQSIADIAKALQPIRNPTYLSYVGVETIDKRELVHLTAKKTFPYISADGQRGTYDSFDIWIEEDGTPVLAKGKITVIGAYGIEISGTSELRFSKFGGPIEIVAPKT